MTHNARWPTTSLKLISQLKNHANGEAWDRFFTAYTPLVERMCRRRGLQAADVEDVSQQVLMAVSRQIPRFQFDPDRGRFRSWLATITARMIARRWEAIGQEKPLGPLGEEISHGESPSVCEEEFQAALLETALSRVQQQVEPLEWQAFVGLWQQDVPALEISRDLRCSLSWVYRTKYKLLQLLSGEVQRLTDDVAFLQR